MNAPDLFALLERHGPEFGVKAPEGTEAVFYNAYFRELREYREPAIEHAFAAWKRGEFDPKRPAMALIFPLPHQIAQLARDWRAPTEFEQITEAFLRPLPADLAPSMTPAEVAARLIEMADAQEAADEVVL